MTLPFPVHVALAALMIAGSAIGFYIDATFGTRFYAGEVGALIAGPYVLLIGVTSRFVRQTTISRT
jgi:hypothetical protein